MFTLPFYLLSSLLALSPTVIGYDIVRDYSGQTFFQGWDFYGSWDNLTLGDVWWLDEQNATSQGLAYINGAGNAVLKVDNTTYVPFNQKRNSVRITTQNFYSFGSLWIVDIVHLPYGCSVWPAFWSKGLNWPVGGEIDIVEGVNLMSSNQMALHTVPGCTHTTPSDQTGISSTLTDGDDCSPGSGCIVTESQPDSFGEGFQGGVWATQFDISGVFIWFWARSDTPASIAQATSSSSIDLSDWGSPSASYPNTTCDMPNFFTDQQIVFDITLCGDWAGVPAIYNATCENSGPTGICYNDNVVGSGSNYDNAYFEISYMRAYTTAATSATSTPTAGDDDSPSITATATATSLADSQQTVSSNVRTGGGQRQCAMGAAFWTFLIASFIDVL